MFTEIYLEPSWTSTIEFYCENNHQLFLQKCSLVDTWQGSKYASGSLDAPCEMRH